MASLNIGAMEWRGRWEGPDEIELRMEGGGG